MHLFNNHAMTKEYKIIRNSEFFDSKWYLETYLDVAHAKMDPVKHYIRYGVHELRNPGPNFNTAQYLKANPDVRKCGMNPLYHYEKYGRREGRTFSCSSEYIDVLDPIFTTFNLIKKTDAVIKFPHFNSVDVSIIIPVYNQFAYTKLCLQSILNNTTDISYEVIIADDNSTDETINISSHATNIKVVRNSENLRFLRNCNNAAKHARGKYLVFLNNDTQVQSDWLRHLIQVIESDSKIGLVGSKLIYPDGTLQEAGGIIYSDASGCNYGRNENPDDLCFNYIKSVDYISGAAIMLRRETWLRLGGFDDAFAPAYYEDTDLAFRIRYELGMDVIYVPKSVVVHFEGKSNGTDITTGQKKFQSINRKKFYNKWRPQLLKYHSRPTSDNFLARDHAVTRKNILVIDWKILSFDKDTGSKTTWQYMKFFQKMGMNVKLFPHDWYIEDDYLSRHLDSGVEVIHENFESFIKSHGSKFDYIYLNRPNIAIHYIDLLRRFTNAKIIYQCHDLHYLRQYRNRMLTDETLAQQLLPTEKQSEYALFNKMDLVCSFSFDEVQEIRQQDEYINATQIPLYILDSRDMSQYKYDASLRQDIMFVAGFQHTPNIDAALWFVHKVFPQIKQHIPDIKLYLVGSNPSQSVLDLGGDDIIVTGFVSEQQLHDLYSRVRLVVTPLRTGAGVKGKIIESVFHKVPVVTTDIGIEGINNTDKIIFVENTPDAFAHRVISLYNDPDTLNHISGRSEHFINTYFSESAVKSALSGYIEFQDTCRPLARSLAPVALFVYNRIDHPSRVIETLLKNPESCETDLYIFSDGARFIDDGAKIRRLRNYLRTVSGFRSVTIHERKTNYGLNINLIDGVGRIMESYDRCIVLEDDITVAPNFLSFMNQCLDKYKSNTDIFTIQATVGNPHATHDVVTRSQPNCWGWATWRDRFDLFERDVSGAFRDINADGMALRRKLNNNNSINISWQIDANLRGERKTWGVYLNLASIKYNKLNIDPRYSLVHNIGQDGTGVHMVVSDTDNINPEYTTTCFSLPDVPEYQSLDAAPDIYVTKYNQKLLSNISEYDEYLYPIEGNV